MNSSASGRSVAVALSGGIDSAAAAVILKQRGLEVLGLSMRLASRGGNAASALESARSVADAVGIRHEVLDFDDEFERAVVDPFVDAYLNGLTPNPCVTCNRDIKFGLLLKAALRFGCEFLATGHYARLEGRETVQAARRRLFRGADPGKDQSYVLWALDQAKLEKLIFPLGDLTKLEAVEAARTAGIEGTAPESQDICFLEGETYSGFVAKRAGSAVEPGPILDTEGNAIGTHRGIPFYTVGQRRGLGLGGSAAKYVVEIRPEDNVIVAGDRSSLACAKFRVSGLNFISGEPPAGEFRCLVKTRYRGPALPAVLRILSEDRAEVSYSGTGPPAAPGQSAVFYVDDELMGGGIICRPAD